MPVASSVAELDKYASDLPSLAANKNADFYISQADGMLKQAGAYRAKGDMERQYVMLSKFSNFVHDKLSQHSQVKSHPRYNELTESASKARQAATNMRPKLEAMYSQPQKTPPTPPRKTSSSKRNLPPPPAKQSSPSSSSSSSSSSYSSPNQGGFADRMMEQTAHNEAVQRQVGSAVGQAAQNEAVQQQVGGAVSSAASNEKWQRQVGNNIAQNSDNVFVRKAASNEAVQRNVGNTVSSAASNKVVQQKAGAAVHRAANDREMQKKAASGAVWGMRKAYSGGKAAATNDKVRGAAGSAAKGAMSQYSSSPSSGKQ